jgi:hypothetical protein
VGPDMETDMGTDVGTDVGTDGVLPQERARFEAESLTKAAQHAAEYVPRVYYYDPNCSVIITELLRPHVPLRAALISGRTLPNMPAHLASYLANVMFHTSLLSMDLDMWRCPRCGLPRSAAPLLGSAMSLFSITALLLLSSSVFFLPHCCCCRRRRRRCCSCDLLRSTAPLLGSAMSFFIRSFTNYCALFLIGAPKRTCYFPLPYGISDLFLFWVRF